MNLRSNNSGIILIIVLWMLVILSILAIGLGRKARIEVALTKHSIGKLKSEYIAWAGVVYAMDQINRDSQRQVDTLYQCGLTFEDTKKPEDILKDISVGEGVFNIRYSRDNDELQQRGGCDNFQDEERKVNINALTKDNYQVLSKLILSLGFEDDTAETIAASIVDWRDQNSDETHSPFGAEEEYYQGLTKPYHCKNRPFDSSAELLLVKGMTEEIYSKLKDLITIFPKEDAALLKININTASGLVIRALGRSFCGGMTNADEEDADSLAEKIVSYRVGDDGLAATEDDRRIDMNELGLNAKERVIFLALKKNTTEMSRYLNVQVQGVDKISGVKSGIEAVIFRDDLSIVSWRRD